MLIFRWPLVRRKCQRRGWGGWGACPGYSIFCPFRCCRFHCWCVKRSISILFLPFSFIFAGWSRHSWVSIYPQGQPQSDDTSDLVPHNLLWLTLLYHRWEDAFGWHNSRMVPLLYQNSSWRLWDSLKPICLPNLCNLCVSPSLYVLFFHSHAYWYCTLDQLWSTFLHESEGTVICRKVVVENAQCTCKSL